jgi:hypothetical protein
VTHQSDKSDYDKCNGERDNDPHMEHEQSSHDGTNEHRRDCDESPARFGAPASAQSTVGGDPSDSHCQHRRRQVWHGQLADAGVLDARSHTQHNYQPVPEAVLGRIGAPEGEKTAAAKKTDSAAAAIAR